MNESEFQSEVVKAAKAAGWRVCHIRPAVQNGRRITPAAKGFPDLVLVKPPRVLFLELKREDGKRGPQQVEWIRDLQACDEVAAYFARPSQLDAVRRLIASEPTTNPGGPPP